MQSLRLNALHELFSDSKIISIPESKKITSFFGENVFDLKKARNFLSDEAYKSLVSSIKNQTKIDRKLHRFFQETIECGVCGRNGQSG